MAAHDESLAARSRRLDELDVERWRAALAAEVERDLKRVAEGSTWTGFVEARLPERQAVLEVLSRGLDPTKRRTFRGRVLLEVRCEKRGHVLARVYPTSVAPVLIPSVSHLPLGRNRGKEQRFGNETYLQVKSWRKLLQRTTMRDPKSYRDEWILDFSDSDRDDDLTVRGLEILTNRHRQETIVYDGVERVPALEMVCRCGTQWVATAEIMKALDTGQRVVRPEVFRRGI